jgi:hypothetical protein
VKQQSIREQFRRNAVALISLFIAVTGLLYNTWRNEHSEYNRNQRWASFEILLMLGDLQEFVFLSYYDADEVDDSDFRRGWAKVLTIRDLSTVLDGPMSVGAVTLHATWDKNWEGLERRDKASKEAIEAEIASLRADTLMTLRDLD